MGLKNIFIENIKHNILNSYDFNLILILKK